MFGTASFLWQRLQKPPIAKWITGFAQRCQAQNVIVHFHNAWMSGVFLPLPVQKNCRVEAISTFHGVNAFLEERPLRHRLHRWMARRLLCYGATLTSVDRANLALAEAIFGLSPDRFHVVPNGVTATSVRACPYLSGSSIFTVGHVGSLIPQKGWNIAAQAVIAAARAGVPCRMIIAGAGPDEAKVRALSDANPSLIDFRGHVRNPRENLMPELDLLAVMSSHEGLPMSAVEALSVGLPVAGTNVGGMAEVVVDGKTGYMVERAAAALQQVIARLAGNRQSLRQLSEGSLEHFQSRFEISCVVEAYQRVYESALGSK
jgi:glycosyltransferase involved in cell wall biosynthesis